MTDRNEGNSNQRPTDREASRLGRERTAEDIPKQASKSRFKTEPGNVTSYTPSAVYQTGIPQRPKIVHDNGFLSLGSRSPTPSDYLKLAKWKAMLEGGEALRSDLVDALAAYRHFLTANGAQRDFSYDRYVASDQSGKITLKNAILDIQTGVIDFYNKNKNVKTFMLTGSAISCGSSANFPYPATENWQKAIGGHSIWLNGTVTIQGGASVKPRFELVMTLNAEDRYNFNPGQQDIVTGIPDSDNGIFEMTGLAHQYDQFSRIKRVLVWFGTDLGVVSSAAQKNGRDRQPSENRRIRNRV